MKDKFLVLMKKKGFRGELNTFPAASAALLALSVVLLLIALLTDRGDFTTAILIVAAFANFFTGIIIAAFTESKGISPLISSMLYSPHSKDKTAFLSGLNVFGDACFIPAELADSEYLMQFNPSGEFLKYNYKNQIFSADEEDTAGIFSRPASDSLIRALKNNFSLYIPKDEISTANFSELLKETLCDALSFCEDITVEKNNDELIVNLKGFILISGCRDIRDESPKCCTVSPCPVCSLAGSLAAEYFRRVVFISALKPDYKKEELMIILSVLSHQPTDEDHDNFH